MDRGKLNKAAYLSFGSFKEDPAFMSGEERRMYFENQPLLKTCNS